MDNLVDAYLEFKAYNVENYTKCVMKHYNSRFKLTNKLIDIVYDYLNEVYLSGDYMSNANLTQITGMKLDRDRNSILALFVDYGAVSRMNLKNKEISDTYLFVVDTILFFIRVESLTNTSKFGCDSFESACKKVFKTNEYENDVILKDIFNGYSNEFIALFNSNLKKNNDFNSLVRDNAFEIEYNKLDDELYLAEYTYNNAILENYDQKEVDYVKKNYTMDIFHYSLQLIILDLIEDLLLEEKKKILIRIPKDIVLKKSLLKVIVDETHIYSIKKNIIFVIDYSVTEKDETILDTLYEKGYDIAVNRDMPMPKNFDLGYSKYLLLEYYNDDEFRNIYKKIGDTVGLVITNHLSKVEKLECLGYGIKYFVKK